MLKIGLTGGIGSGKTMVANVFMQLGIPVYHADIHAKIIENNDPDVRKELISLLGQDIYTDTGLDRAKLAAAIFNDKHLLSAVNSVIHPRVRKHFFKWMESYSHCGYIIQEAAILFESGAYKFFDRYVTVTADKEIRIKRLLKRKGMTYEKILKIMDNQISEEEKIRRSHYVIINNDDIPVLPQILRIHHELLFDN